MTDLAALDAKLARAWGRRPPVPIEAAARASRPPLGHQEVGGGAATDPPTVPPPIAGPDQRFAEIQERHRRVMKNWRLLHQMHEEARWRILGCVLLGDPED